MAFKSEAELFKCPKCGSQYKLVRVEAEPDPSHGRIDRRDLGARRRADREIECRAGDQGTPRNLRSVGRPRANGPRWTRRLCDEIRQLGDVRGNPPRLVTSEQLCRRSPAGLTEPQSVAARRPVIVSSIVLLLLLVSPPRT